jgi:glycosyltransferase involved in cell wall biosynthesis
MRILHVNDSDEIIGGVEVYLSNLVNLQRENAQIVEILYSKSEQDRAGIITLLSRIYNPIALVRMIKKIKEFKPDIIHFHSILYYISPSVMHAAKLLNVPSIISIHDYSIVCPNSYFIDQHGIACKQGFGYQCLTRKCVPYNKKIKYWILRIYRTIKLLVHRSIIKNNADHILSPSDNLSKWLQTNLGVNPLTVYLFTELKAQITPIITENNLLYVGRVEEGKGIDCLLHALKIVKEKFSDVRLVVAGKGNSLEKSKQLAESLGLSSSITFSGFVSRDKLSKYYQNSKIVVIPSNYAENFSSVGVEAITFGRPIIVSDEFGLVERIHGGKVGLSFRMGDSKDLAEKIITLLTDQQLEKKLSNNTKKAVKLYSKNKHYNHIIEIYEKMITIER